MCDHFDAAIVRRYLPAAVAPELELYDTIPSTNTRAKEAAEAGAPVGTVIAAVAQTSGRGRRGRSFLSPAGSGLYMSVILRPNLPAEEAAAALTTAAAVALCRALSSLGVQDARIKWVNDVWRGKRKIAGILTEASFDAQGKLAYAVLGIGVNLLPPVGGFAPEIAEIAGAALDSPLENARERLLASFLTEFFAIDIAHADHIAEYRRLCFIPGCDVIVHPSGGTPYPAHATAIDDRFHLVVALPSGEKIPLDSGEVSVRME